jgi:hypothetical protein
VTVDRQRPPAATLIGTGGINPPTEVVDDDNFATFDPRATASTSTSRWKACASPSTRRWWSPTPPSFGETWVVASGGAGATGLNARGGMTISAGDFNPERIQLEDGILSPGYIAAHTQGDRLADVTGIMSYGFNSPELLVTGGVTVTSDVTLGREATALKGDRDHLTVASYNVENLDPTDAQAKFDLLAKDIVYSLGAPDILALQEVQDADGAGNGSDLSGRPPRPS